MAKWVPHADDSGASSPPHANSNAAPAHAAPATSVSSSQPSAPVDEAAASASTSSTSSTASDPPTEARPKSTGWRGVAKALSIPVTLFAGIATVAQVVYSVRNEPSPTAPSETSETASSWRTLREAFDARAAATKTRPSGQSTLMDETFAGQRACDPEHDEPFVIEWDATDRSSFESLAADDVVMVAYDGCELRLVDRCRHDQVRGALGSYRPPVWTSPSLESIDIHDDAELRTKLPLSRKLLGERVAAGEQFHMEYSVSGTVYATRGALYRDDLEALPGCAEVTHFVYGYNLGAFALGSSTKLDIKAGTSVYGFGVEGAHGSKREADKRGGDLGACAEVDADAGHDCKAPIRLKLRPISEGEDPEDALMRAQDTEGELNAAGVIEARFEQAERASKYVEAATKQSLAGDGAGCLASLDAYDQLVDEHRSTDPTGYMSVLRFPCLMKAGKCTAGQTLARKYYENNTQSAPADIEAMVEHAAVEHCQGTKLSPRIQLLQAEYRLRMATLGADAHPKLELCEREWARGQKLVDRVEPRDDADVVHGMTRALWNAGPMCFVRAGDCERAWAAFHEGAPTAPTPSGVAPPNGDRAEFETFYPECAEG